MSGTVKGIIVEIGGDTSGLQKALSKINSASSSLSKELRGINSLLKLDPSNTILVKQKQEALAESISTTEDKLKSLKEAQEQADNIMNKGGEINKENYRALQREILLTENKLKDLKTEASGWTTVSEKLDNVSKSFESIGKKITGVGKKATVISTAVASLAVASVKVGADFESSMKQVAATMGITVKEIENGSESYKILEEAAQKCGETTKYSASEAADALNYLALAGYDAKKSAEVLPKVLNLAAAGDLELATASDMVTDAMAALNMETKDLDKYINEMAKTSQKSNTSVAQLGEATLTCAGTVNLAGMSLETMNAELGILANNGIKGAEGGTHLRNIILSLTSPTDVATKALKNLGIKVTDSSGNIRDMNDIMADFNKKLDGMSDEKKTNIISQIFNKTDISAVNALIKGSGEEFTNLKGQISNCNGAAQDMADTMNSSLKGQITLLKSQIEGIAIKLSRMLIPILKKIVDKISSVLTWVSNLNEKTQKIILIVGGIVTAIGPLLIIIGQMSIGFGALLGVLSSVASKIALFSATLSSGAGLGAALTAVINPVTLVVAALAGLAAGFVYLWNTSEAFRSKVLEIIDVLVAFYNDNIKPILEGLVEFVQSVIDTIIQTVQTFWAYLEPLIEQALNWLKDFWENTGSQIVSNVSDIVGKLINFATMIWNNVISPIINWLLQHLLPKIQSTMSIIINIIQGVFDFIGNIVQMITGVLDGLITFITGVFSGNWSQAWNGIVQIFQNIFGGIAEIAKIPINAMIDLINGFLGGLNGIKIPDWVPGVGGKGFSIPLIPKLAKGGIVDSATLAMIGEGNSAEAVIPLDRTLTKYLSEALKDIGAVGTGNITVNFYPQKMTEAEMDNAFNYINRRFGKLYPI